MVTAADHEIATGSVAEAMIARAWALQPELRQAAAECETSRRVSDAAIARLKEARLFDLVKPKRYGGLELGWDVFAEAVIALASGCGSTGWVYSVVGGHAPVVARFGTKFLDELWGDDAGALIASSRRSAGALERVQGGYRGGGIGAFSSGCLNAQWVIVESMPVQGEARPVTVIVPRSELEILDSWNALGLAGTGSHDVRFRDAFIPEHRSWYPGKPPAGEALDGPLFRTPFLGGPFALPSVVLGIAIAGLEHFTAMTHGRSSRLSTSMAELPAMQARIGQSAIEIDAALALLRQKTRDLMAALSGAMPSLAPEQHMLPPGGAVHGYDQTANSFIAHTAYKALERLMEAAGAHQLALSAPFQRCFRDALAGIQQPSNNWDNGRVEGGRALLARLKPAAREEA